MQPILVVFWCRRRACCATMIRNRRNDERRARNTRPCWRCVGLYRGKPMILAGTKNNSERHAAKRGLVNQKRGTSHGAHRQAAAFAALAIAAMLCTGYARARDRSSEEVLTSCRPDLMRVCDRFTGRGDADAAMFCLRDNFKSLRVECRRVMPTAAERKEGPKRGVKKLPIVLHRE